MLHENLVLHVYSVLFQNNLQNGYSPFLVTLPSVSSTPFLLETAPREAELVTRGLVWLGFFLTGVEITSGVAPWSCLWPKGDGKDIDLCAWGVGLVEGGVVVDVWDWMSDGAVEDLWVSKKELREGASLESRW